jgi:hypothetical protein
VLQLSGATGHPLAGTQTNSQCTNIIGVALADGADASSPLTSALQAQRFEVHIDPAAVEH